MNNNKILFLVGPTAVGKSDIAFYLAQKFCGEIVSCDSMQIYKEISIASNKPSKDVIGRVAHHLVDVLSVCEEFNVAQFNQLACKAIEGILSRDHLPIIVGGSGMYMQVLLDGIFKGGVKNEALRKDLNEQAKQYGNQYLHDKLQIMDPGAARKIHPNDLRRVVRALEIGMTEEVPISQLQKDREGLWGKYDITLYALDRSRYELYDRINRRVDQMLDEGLVDEIRDANSGRWSKTAEKIIGIQEVKGYLSGRHTLKEAADQIKLNTRHLAKRQLTWFRREKRLNWIMIDQESSQQSIAQSIAHEWESQSKAGHI